MAPWIRGASFHFNSPSLKPKVLGTRVGFLEIEEPLLSSEEPSYGSEETFFDLEGASKE
jgi:hypothetical protein